MNSIFRKFSAFVSYIVGSAPAFVVAVLIILTWAATGPIFNYSDTWQLIINTSTTIITFLMVFLIQNTQNRDSKSIKLQLDEIIESMQSASDKYVDMDEMSDEELERLSKHFKNVHQRFENHQQKRKSKTNSK